MGRQQYLQPLDRVEAAHASQHEVIGPEPETLPVDRRSAQQAVHLLEVHPVDDHHALLGAEEMEAQPLRLLGGGHVDDGAAEAREPPLERQVEPLGDGRVAPVVDAVERVDRRDAQPAGGQPAVEPRPLAVCVHQTDAEAADQPHVREQLPDTYVSERDLDHRDPQVLEPVEEDTVARRANHELELALRQVADQVIDVLGSAPGAGADQELQDPNWATHGGQDPRRTASDYPNVGVSRKDGPGDPRIPVAEPARTHPPMLARNLILAWLFVLI